MRRGVTRLRSRGGHHADRRCVGRDPRAMARAGSTRIARRPAHRGRCLARPVYWLFHSMCIGLLAEARQFFTSTVVLMLLTRRACASLRYRSCWPAAGWGITGQATGYVCGAVLLALLLAIHARRSIGFPFCAGDRLTRTPAADQTGSAAPTVILGLCYRLSSLLERQRARRVGSSGRSRSCLSLRRSD